MNMPPVLSDPLRLELADSDTTIALGAAVGAALLAAADAGFPLSAILLFGDLGSGKTTFTRGLASALPGGADAEVSSPSFTVCNQYPTRPLLVHCDLYRDANALGFAAGLPEEAEDALEHGAQACVVAEWAQRLLPADRPLERLDILLESCHDKHVATLTPCGAAAMRVVQELVRSGWSAPTA